MPADTTLLTSAELLVRAQPDLTLRAAQPRVLDS